MSEASDNSATEIDHPVTEAAMIRTHCIGDTFLVSQLKVIPLFEDEPVNEQSVEFRRIDYRSTHLRLSGTIKPSDVRDFTVHVYMLDLYLGSFQGSGSRMKIEFNLFGGSGSICFVAASKRDARDRGGARLMGGDLNDDVQCLVLKWNVRLHREDNREVSDVAVIAEEDG